MRTRPCWRAGARRPLRPSASRGLRRRRRCRAPAAHPGRPCHPRAPRTRARALGSSTTSRRSAGTFARPRVRRAPTSAVSSENLTWKGRELGAEYTHERARIDDVRARGRRVAHAPRGFHRRIDTRRITCSSPVASRLGASRAAWSNPPTPSSAEPTSRVVGHRRRGRVRSAPRRRARYTPDHVRQDRRPVHDPRPGPRRRRGGHRRRACGTSR